VLSGIGQVKSSNTLKRRSSSREDELGLERDRGTGIEEKPLSRQKRRAEAGTGNPIALILRCQ
jgi:hypothetical protein